MSLCRSFETNKYIGYVILGEGIIRAKMKDNETNVYIGNIKDMISEDTNEDIKSVIYEARYKATGCKYL